MKVSKFCQPAVVDVDGALGEVLRLVLADGEGGGICCDEDVETRVRCGSR